MSGVPLVPYGAGPKMSPFVGVAPPPGLGYPADNPFQAAAPPAMPPPLSFSASRPLQNIALTAVQSATQTAMGGSTAMNPGLRGPNTDPMGNARSLAGAFGNGGAAMGLKKNQRALSRGRYIR